jgi:UDP-N-acetylmuramate dehydrogenase
MRIEQNYSLEKHNTFHLPVKTRWFMEYETEEELQRILHDEYFQECLSLHIGGGSNLLFINDYNGIIIHSRIKGISISAETDEYVSLRVGAAEIWDDVVAYAVLKGWGGIENLSLIPGEAGAAAIQNIGAYGMEIKDVIESVEAYNQLTFEKRTFTNTDCEYGYRNSYFKNDPHIITYITLRLSKNPSFSVNYGNLKEELTKYPEVTLETIREAVITIRRQKLPDPEVLGNAGSFFMNPIITAEHFEKAIPGNPVLSRFGRKDQGSGRLVDRAMWV